MDKANVVFMDIVNVAGQPITVGGGDHDAWLAEGTALLYADLHADDAEYARGQRLARRACL